MIISSIDIQENRVVQLRQGRTLVVERNDPLALACEFGRIGEVAVIDLDAAMGRGHNRELVRRLLPLADCRVGGGIRSVAEARQWISWGARKVIVGSAVFAGGEIDHAFLGALAEALGRERVIVALDSWQGEVVTQGWAQRTGLRLEAQVATLEPYCGEFLFTAVEREGGLLGLDSEWLSGLRRLTTNRITVAGGAQAPGDIESAAALDIDVQVGLALYTGKLDPVEAFIAGLRWREPLLPTVVCDEAGRVLMLAYSSRESLRISFREGQMAYHSRSRGALWRKGETSGHRQQLLRLRADCDRDALRATVRQCGVACHRGDYSCFGDERFGWSDLYSLVSRRLADRPSGSYTASLDDAGVRAKVLEEAAEVVEAEAENEIVWEAADLLFFLTVLLARAGIGPERVLAELARRRKP